MGGGIRKRGSGKHRANQNILRKHGGAAVIEANKSFDVVGFKRLVKMAFAVIRE